MKPNFELEDKLFQQGVRYVAGLDEVGRGCLAGPVAAGLVIFPQEIDRTLLIDINDSKKLSESKRQSLDEVIRKYALVAEVAITEPDEIDEIGIVGATKLAMERCIQNSLITPEHLLIDAIKLDGLHMQSSSIIKGDQISTSIAAASIIAKVFRDELMISLDSKYLGYGLSKNKGYGTKTHLEAIFTTGYSEIHRKSFEPIKSLIEK